MVGTKYKVPRVGRKKVVGLTEIFGNFFYLMLAWFNGVEQIYKHICATIIGIYFWQTRALASAGSKKMNSPMTASYIAKIHSPYSLFSCKRLF